MATIHADSSNIILMYLRSAEEEKMFPVPPVGTISTVIFDDITNAILANDLSLSTDLYRLNGAVLTKGGVEVVINSDGEDAVINKTADSMVDDFTTWLGLSKPTTNAQKELILDRLARCMRFLIRDKFDLE